MKVAIDTFGCGHGRTGLGSYLDSLTARLKNQDDCTFKLFGPEIDRYTYGQENGLEFSSVKIPEGAKWEKLWHLTSANSFLKKHKYDVALYTAAARFLPLTFKVPGVAVVNDVLSEVFTVDGSSRTFGQKISIEALKNVDRIIAASRYIQNDLVRFGIKIEKITVIHNGIDHKLFYPRNFSSSDLVDIKPFAIKRPYFIYASRLSSSAKRHVELIKAFSLFKEKTHLPHRLVLAGSDGEYSDDVHKAAFLSHFASDIFMTGFFPHESFPELYSASSGCIFPAENEGVGLPVLEAMASGIPVACSRSGALSEIAGNVALYFDSENIEQMAAAFEAFAQDSDMRKDLVANGLEHAKEFNWQSTAEKTIAVLKEVCGK